MKQKPQHRKHQRFNSSKMTTSAKDFFTPEEQKQIVDSIRDAERKTSGEIRVHLDVVCPVATLDRAVHVFEDLEMHETKERNGVLLYMAIQDKKFAIIGDVGVNRLVSKDFWEKCKENTLEAFGKGDFVKGLQQCIAQAADILKQHFPYQKDDINELPDELSFEQ